MRRIAAMVVIVLAMLPGIVVAQTPVASPATSSHATLCDGWDAYRGDLVNAKFPITDDEADAMDRIGGVMFADYMGIPPQTLRTASGYLETYATRLDQIPDVPDTLHPLHAAYVERVVLLSHFMGANLDGDPWAIALYGDRMSDNVDEIESIVAVIAPACPSQWALLTSGSPRLFPLMWSGWAEPKPAD